MWVVVGSQVVESFFEKLFPAICGIFIGSTLYVTRSYQIFMVGFNIINLLAVPLPVIVATFAICKRFGPSSDQVRHLDPSSFTGCDGIPVRKKILKKCFFSQKSADNKKHEKLPSMQ